MRKTINVNIMGMKVDIDDRIDCPKCNASDMCEWTGLTYDTPCSNCKDSKEYKEDQGEIDKHRGNVWGRIEKSKPAGVFTTPDGKTDLVVDGNGDVIGDTPHGKHGNGKKGEASKMVTSKSTFFMK